MAKRKGFFDFRYKSREPIYFDRLGTEFQSVGMILKGKADNTLYIYLPEETIPAEDKRQHVVLNSFKWASMLYQMDRPVHRITDEDGNLKAVVGKNKRAIATHVQWEVYRRDGYKCVYCRRDDVPLTIDHKIPVEQGGTDDKSNLCAACRKCNRRKGDMTPKEWEEYLEKRANSATKSKEICYECGRSVARGSGRFINRIPSLGSHEDRVESNVVYPEGEWLCAECDDAAKRGDGKYFDQFRRR